MAVRQGRNLIRVLVVDDHPLVRFGVCSLLKTEADIEVCGEADSSRQALRIFEKLRPDVVLVDISLEKESGLDLIECLKLADPRVKCLVISLLDEMLYAERAFQVGAVGYVSKSEPLSEIVDAVRRVAAGRTRLSSDVSDHFFRKMAVSGFSKSPRSPVSGLTDRELQVFQLVGRGCETRDIARQLNLSPKTVSTYYENIKRKLDLSNKTELVRHAVTWLMERG